MATNTTSDGNASGARTESVKASLAQAVGRLLAQPVASHRNPVGAAQAPAMERKRNLLAVQRKVQHRLAVERKRLRDKDHVIPEPHTDSVLEKKLKRVATRGVVKLFNAVSAQQRKLGVDDARSALRDPKLESLSKSGFLQHLQAAATGKSGASPIRVKEEETSDAPPDDDRKPVTQVTQPRARKLGRLNGAAERKRIKGDQDARGWSVLSDTFGMEHGRRAAEWHASDDEANESDGTNERVPL